MSSSGWSSQTLFFSPQLPCPPSLKAKSIKLPHAGNCWNKETMKWNDQEEDWWPDEDSGQLGGVQALLSLHCWITMMSHTRKMQSKHNYIQALSSLQYHVSGGWVQSPPLQISQWSVLFSLSGKYSWIFYPGLLTVCIYASSSPHLHINDITFPHKYIIIRWLSKIIIGNTTGRQVPSFFYCTL